MKPGDPAGDAAAPEPEAKQRVVAMRLRQDAWLAGLLFAALHYWSPAQ